MSRRILLAVVRVGCVVGAWVMMTAGARAGVEVCCDDTTSACTTATPCPPGTTLLSAGSCIPNPCVGSCCNLNSGACTPLTQSQCPAGFSVWLGGPCTAGGCPSGACCDPIQAMCTVTGPSGCFFGPSAFTANAACAPSNPCPGACCDAATSGCTHVAQGSCTGSWSGGVCIPNPCVGSCCNLNSGVCTPQSQFMCPTITSVWFTGPCGPGACPSGTCCDPIHAVCTVTGPSGCFFGPSAFTANAVCTPSNPCAGSCCDPTTSACAHIAEGSCMGTWSPGVCIPNPCAGACCNLNSGQCVFQSQILCPIVTGLWIAGTCGTVMCPSGACCESSGSFCHVTGPLGCFGGPFMNNETCTPNDPCPGACCDPANLAACTVTTRSLCVGVFNPGPCGPGICATLTTCCDTTSGACSTNFSGLCGAGTVATTPGVCSPNPCPQPLACCDTTTGACAVVAPGATGAVCGPGTAAAPGNAAVCSPQPCPQPTACCNVITGACVIALPGAACPALGIAATPATASCSPYPCAAALMSPAAMGVLCDDCTYVNGAYDGRDGQLSHLGGASPHGSKAADDLFLCEGFVYDLRTFSATLFTTTFPGLVKPKGEIWSDCNGCPAEKLYTFDNPLVVETGLALSTPAFDGRALRIVNVTFDVTRETYLPNRNVVLHGGRYWVSIYGVSDNLGPSMQMYDVTYWGTTGGPIKGKPAYKIDGIPGLPYNQYSFPVGCGPGAWHSVTDDCCIGCTDLNFSFCTTPCKVLVDNGPARIQQGNAPNGSTSQFAAGSGSAAETRSADDFVVPSCQIYRICYVEACVLTNCPTFEGVFELYVNNCNKPSYALHGQPAGGLQFTATKIVPLGPAYQSVIDGKILQGYRLEFHDVNVTLHPATGGTWWIGVGVRYTFSVNERAYFCYNSSCASSCLIRWNEGRVLTSATLDEEARAAGCISAAPAPLGCNGWAKTGNDFSFLIAADGETLPGPINSNPSGPVCRADYNGDGTVAVQDIFDFLSAWFGGCP